jgi:hypothetical protein
MARYDIYDIDGRIALGAMALTLAVAIVAAAQGYVAAGFLLFIAAATPFPAIVAMRAGRWLRARWGHRGTRGRFRGEAAGAVRSTPAEAMASHVSARSSG